MSTPTAVARRSSLARRAAEGTLTAYLREESRRDATRTRPAGRRSSSEMEPAAPPRRTPGAQCERTR